MLIEDLREEVAITNSCAYKPCYLLASDFEEFKPKLELGKLYCHYVQAPNYSKPIVEVEIWKSNNFSNFVCYSYI